MGSGYERDQRGAVTWVKLFFMIHKLTDYLWIRWAASASSSLSLMSWRWSRRRQRGLMLPLYISRCMCNVFRFRSAPIKSCCLPIFSLGYYAYCVQRSADNMLQIIWTMPIISDIDWNFSNMNSLCYCGDVMLPCIFNCHSCKISHFIRILVNGLCNQTNRCPETQTL